MAVNLTYIEGRIPREPDARVLESGVAMWSATLAHTEAIWDSKKQAEVPHTSWIRIVAFGQTADDLTDQNVAKGDALLVTGQLKTQEIEKDGKKETKTSVEVKDFNVTRRSFRQAQQQGGFNAGGFGS